MELAFSSKEIRRICQNSEVAEELFGKETSAELKHRLSDLRSGRTVYDLPRSILEKSEFNGGEAYLVEISREYCLKFIPNHVETPQNCDGAVDWHRVYRIKIEEITHQS